MCFNVAGVVPLAATVRMVAGLRTAAIAGLLLIPYVIFVVRPSLWFSGLAVFGYVLARLPFCFTAGSLFIACCLGPFVRKILWPVPVILWTALPSLYWTTIAVRERQSSVIGLNGAGLVAFMAGEPWIAGAFWLAASIALVNLAIAGYRNKRS